MAKKKEKSESTFVLTLAIYATSPQEMALNNIFEISRYLYNACLAEGMRRLNNLLQSKKYRKIQRQLKALHAKIEKEKVASKRVIFEKEIKELYKKRNEIADKFGYNEFSMYEFIAPMKRHFGRVDINTAQKIATRAFDAVEKVRKGIAKKVRFKKFFTMESIEGKTNKSGIIFRKEKDDYWLKLSGMKLKVNIPKQDIYALEALGDLSNICYCRIVKEIIRGQERFFLQLTIKGTPPAKRVRKTGEFKRKLGSGRSGVDINMQTVAVVSKDKVLLQELAPNVQLLEDEKRLLQRKMNRSTRATNPKKFNLDGTFNTKNKDPWNRSKNYMKDLYKLKDASRKQKAIRKQDHNILANEILAMGDLSFVEFMNFKALQKRAKETKVNPKTGRFYSKKRFGKTITNKAPAMLISILKYKMQYFKGSLSEVNTRTVKASQYDHMKEDYTKKPLSQRWHIFEDGSKVQRDLYSAFLLMNVSDDLQQVNQSLCKETFEAFKKLHDEKIKELKLLEHVPASMGI